MNMEEVPRTAVEAIRYFADADKCHDFMVAIRWPDGVHCAHCNSDRVGKLVKSGNRRLWNCKACKKQFTAKVHTIFEDSPLGLDKWLPALWMIVNAKNGVSSCELARSLGVTQRSAWFMSHRIRASMHDGIFSLAGQVEADETFIGAKARNMHKGKRKVSGTGIAGKAAVLGLLERSTDKKASRVRLKVGANTRNVRQYVLKGSEVFTDALASYVGLHDEYTHKVIDHPIMRTSSSVRKFMREVINCPCACRGMS